MTEHQADILLKKIVEWMVIKKNDPGLMEETERLYQALFQAGYKCAPKDGINEQHISNLYAAIASLLSYITGVQTEYGFLTEFTYDLSRVTVTLDRKTGRKLIDLGNSGESGIAHVILILMDIANTPRVGVCSHCTKFFFHKRAPNPKTENYCNKKCNDDARNQRVREAKK